MSRRAASDMQPSLRSDWIMLAGLPGEHGSAEVKLVLTPGLDHSVGRGLVLFCTRFPFPTRQLMRGTVLDVNRIDQMTCMSILVRL